MDTSPSTLVYDGDCNICQEWVDHWRCLTGDRIEYRPYQEAAGDFPGLAVEDLQRSIQLIEPDGTVSSAAEATFKLYRGIHPHSLLLILYRFVPGFALCSELAYRFLSTHRGLLACITHVFWGKHFRPPQ
ncbi:MAG: DUF393 domain-containing protein, partial [Thiotrichales bacterium]|nr:DUF393 domain-containing protein [Thiotrichales bacterium]